MAHEQNITLNQLAVNILEEYINRESNEQRTIQDNVVNAVKNIVDNGVTVETLEHYGRVYNVWMMECHGLTTSTELIQKGFDRSVHGG